MGSRSFKAADSLIPITGHSIQLGGHILFALRAIDIELNIAGAVAARLIGPEYWSDSHSFRFRVKGQTAQRWFDIS